jgi:hypothetical protein
VSYEIEVMRKVFDNGIGKSIDVGPDKDGLGCVEIDGGEDWGRLVIQPQHALFLAKAITECALEMGAEPLS